MPDDHSELVPLLPIPNRTVKRLSADDSAGSRVKVGHRQALTALKSPSRNAGAFVFSGSVLHPEHGLPASAVQDPIALPVGGARTHQICRELPDPDTKRDFFKKALMDHCKVGGG